MKMMGGLEFQVTWPRWPPCWYMEKKYSEIFFSWTSSPMSLKLGMQHRGPKLYKVLHKWWPWVDLGLYYGKVKFGCLYVWMGENCYKVFKWGETFSKGLNWHYKCVNEKNDPLGLSAPDHPLQASIHVYDYNFKRPVFLKSLGQS